MTNQRQTAQEIYYILKGSLGLENELSKKVATRISQTLAKAGLIADDLPEENDLDISAPDEKVWLPCGPIGPSVWARPGGRVRVRRIEPGDLTPDEASFFAFAVLAAAQYAKGEA